MGKTLDNYRFLLGLSRLHIGEPLGTGDKIYSQIFLTNDKKSRMKFLTPRLREAVGFLEAQALMEADALIYAEGAANGELTPDKSLALLDQLLHWARMFLHALWLVKDNAVNFELGFLEVSASSGAQWVQSNFLAHIVYNATGTRSPVSFSRHDLRKAREHFSELLLPLASTEAEHPISASVQAVQSATSQPAVPRLKRAFYLLDAARTYRDLGLKVAMYCSLLESLFSTDGTEIIHKIAHRIALFLEDIPDNRRDLYARVKKAYGIRSKVVHGDALDKEGPDKVRDIAVDADEVARRVLLKICTSNTLMTQFQASKSSLDDYFLTASFSGKHDGVAG